MFSSHLTCEQAASLNKKTAQYWKFSLCSEVGEKVNEKTNWMMLSELTEERVTIQLPSPHINYKLAKKRRCPLPPFKSICSSWPRTSIHIKIVWWTSFDAETLGSSQNGWRESLSSRFGQKILSDKFYKIKTFNQGAKVVVFCRTIPEEGTRVELFWENAAIFPV